MKNVKLSRALSCDSVISDTSEFGDGDQLEPKLGFNDRMMEIPDITSWLKNPTDFIKSKPSITLNYAPDYSDSSVPGRIPTSVPVKNGRIRSQSIDSGADFSLFTENCVQSSDPGLLVSMSYLPTAERLSVVTVRMKLPEQLNQSIRLVYVKAYLIDDITGKRTCKKKTRLVSILSILGILSKYDHIDTVDVRYIEKTMIIANIGVI